MPCAARMPGWAGVLAALSFLVPAPWAIALVIPYAWFVVRLGHRGWFLIVGVGWLGAHRLGWDLMGYPPYWVALTAAHFHVAGFALPEAAWRLRARAAIAVIVIGVPATAIAIGFWHGLEPVAGMDMATGGMLVAIACLRARRWVAALALCASMPLAALYATGTYLTLDEMASSHGVLNLCFAYAMFGLAAPGLARSRARLGDIGGATRSTGTCDRLEEFAHEGYDPAATAPEIRDFYEHVARYRIAIVPRWSLGFATAGRIWHRIATRMGQLALPIAAGPIRSRIVAVTDDGRAGARGWIRESADGAPMFVSAYAVCDRAMSVGFPLPGGLTMTSVNYFAPLPDGGVHVSTERGGVYLGRIRLPIAEAIDLRVERGVVVGRQVMRVAGIPFLRVDYTITREADEARVEVAGDPAPA